ncbi:MAG TPA: FliA/WhiG family RNA polymerase sigma factor [Phycisphaerae bacterium]|nr:FliA/WhiG family RNA polymerase sigma factor [Phycisphaerae bacterium]HNU46176.1 FliA/WhiG family RNA polymerase sigma factor [Phycisphaerae bacterium]
MRLTKKEADPAALWRQFRRTPSKALRNRLMENYLPIVKYNAERISAKLPDEVEYDDLVSAGVFGLIDAIEAFDIGRGVKFETYCSPRIRGAMLDELRSMDWVPRLVRSRAHKIERIAAALQSTLGRTPTGAEMADHLRVPEDEYEKFARDATAVMQISLSRRYNESDSNRELCEIDVIEDRRGRDPINDLQRKDLKELITRGLTRAERLILILYYYEEMTMKEIGATLDLSESRVSQMHSAILARLKTQLELRRKELVR